LPEVGVEDLKIRPRGDNRCESAKKKISTFQPYGWWAGRKYKIFLGIFMSLASKG